MVWSTDLFEESCGLRNYTHTFELLHFKGDGANFASVQRHLEAHSKITTEVKTCKLNIFWCKS